MEGKAEVREIRYIHQGPPNGIGWQVIVTDILGDITILKESIYKEVAEEYATEYNKEVANEHRERGKKKR